MLKTRPKPLRSLQEKALDDGNQKVDFQYGRNVFEGLFAAQADPWLYTNPYEQTKYEQTLALLPTKRIHSALELACAEGHFTVQLAGRVDRLVAADISRRGTGARCPTLRSLFKYILSAVRFGSPANS